MKEVNINTIVDEGILENNIKLYFYNLLHINPLKLQIQKLYVMFNRSNNLKK